MRQFAPAMAGDEAAVVSSHFEARLFFVKRSIAWEAAAYESGSPAAARRGRGYRP